MQGEELKIANQTEIVENADLVQLREFLDTYRDKAKFYREYVNIDTGIELNFNNSITNAYDNKRMGKWLIIGGVITLPIAIGLILIPFGIVSILIGNKQINKSILVKRAEIKKGNTRKKQIIIYLKEEYNKTNKFVHFNYSSPFIIDRLIDYIETGRASTLKEALNIYENEASNFKNRHPFSLEDDATSPDYLAFNTVIRDKKLDNTVKN